jgi:hypothetical protein
MSKRIWPGLPPRPKLDTDHYKKDYRLNKQDQKYVAAIWTLFLLAIAFLIIFYAIYS